MDDDFTAKATAPSRPGYMTVGSGSTSEAASRLVSMLDNDSGYGGSLMDGDHPDRAAVDEALISDLQDQLGEHGKCRRFRLISLLTRYRRRPRPTESREPHHAAALVGPLLRVSARPVAHITSNQNRTSLVRAIYGTVDALQRFQAINQKWPVHYPAVPPDTASSSTMHGHRPSLSHSLSTVPGSAVPDSHPPRPHLIRRADTSFGGDTTVAESSSAAARANVREPRLVTLQLAHDFSALKLELRKSGRTQTDVVHSLAKSSIPGLLDDQIQESIQHLHSLKERIEDTSSKVLVTGDLNAGKSTFCNAVLRRKILPEDQQPCTSIFCEVLDVQANGGVEEVHAIPIGVPYNRRDETTYTVFSLQDLDKIVVDHEHYAQCKIYVQNVRSVDQSLLNNGVVDIALIDAPGLNNDSLKTTAVFARQEEIDVVVFVVSAPNHFTLSAKDFIFNAAREKAYIFMVVNGFDNIQDKQRCQQMILKQVAHLSPATFKEARELVHFVSSNAVPVSSTGSLAGSSASGSGPGPSPPSPVARPDGDDGPPDGGDEADRSEPRSKGKEPEKIRDFENLEASLRRFVLEKRARSKLAPAKTYLSNVLGDVHNLASVNLGVAESEMDRVNKEIEALEPEYEQSKQARAEASITVERIVDDSASEVYDHTRDALTECIGRVAEQDLGIPYPGFLSVYQYAEDIRDAMLHQISGTVHACEEHARTHASQGYNGIKNLGIIHLGHNHYADVMLRPERMFRKPMHALTRQVDIEIEGWDFFDVAGLWERQEKVAGTSMAVTVAGMVGGRVVGGVGWLGGALSTAKSLGFSNVRRLAVPALCATGTFIRGPTVFIFSNTLQLRLASLS